MGFLLRLGRHWLHAPAPSLPLAPRSCASPRALRCTPCCYGLRWPPCRLHFPPAQRPCRKLLLRLHRIALEGWLRQDVRASQVRLPLVGHQLRQAAHPTPIERLQRRPASAPPRSRHLRPALSLKRLRQNPSSPPWQLETIRTLFRLYLYYWLLQVVAGGIPRWPKSPIFRRVPSTCSS